MYQRLGLEDDIVDPSNTLLREGPVLKISFRRSDPMERYLFLVVGCRGATLHWGGKSMGSPGTAGGTGKSLLLCPLLWTSHMLPPHLKDFQLMDFPRHALGSNRVRI